MSDTLTLEMATDLAETVEYRQTQFDEDLATSIKVVVLNYGDNRTRVGCIGKHRWTGTKADAMLHTPPGGIPICPSGHPLIEHGTRYRLGLVLDPPQ